jgi:hypothetical protein
MGGAHGAFGWMERHSRRWRSTPLSRVLLSGLLGGGLLVALAPAASATPYDLRGEWSIAITPQTLEPLQGAAIIDTMEANGEFSGSLELDKLAGTISGTVSNEETSIKAVVVAPQGTFTFIADKAIVKSAESSVSGSGELYKNGKPFEPATVTATRVKTYKEVQEREARELKEQEEKEAKEKKEREEKEEEVRREREAKERQAREEQEAKERSAREQKEKELKKRELEAREAQETQTRELKERELKERQEREAREAAEKGVLNKAAQIPTPSDHSGDAPAVSIEPAHRTLTVGRGGAISLGLTNPNAFPAYGRLKLTIIRAATLPGAKHRLSGRKNLTLTDISFSISGHATRVVKIRFSRRGLASLVPQRSSRVLATIITQVGNGPGMSKTYGLTLHAIAHR